MDAVIIGNAAFFAPDIFTAPFRGYPPLITNFFNGIFELGLWRPSVYAECMDFLSHIAPQRSINDLMPIN